MIKHSINDIPPEQIGEKLRIARENADITQAAAAEAINAARTTLLSIEKGQRRVRIEELQALCRLYGTSVNSLLRDEAVLVNFDPKFRKLPECKDEAIESATKLLSDLVRAELELENVLGVKRTRNDPPERPILPGDVKSQAEQDAQELRNWLGIGSGPITDMVSLLEISLGARVYIRKIDGRISGAFVYSDEPGACILLNANHPRTRRNQSAAHELAHFVSTRKNAEITRDDMFVNSREERYADSFGRYFMTPTRTVMQKFKEVTAGATHLTRRHIIILAHYFGVSREAMAKRLEELQLTKSGTWDWFSKEGGISDEQAKQVLGDRFFDDKETGEPTNIRLNLLASEAYQQGFLSEGQLSSLLQMSRVELRKVVDEHNWEEDESADETILPE